MIPIFHILSHFNEYGLKSSYGYFMHSKNQAAYKSSMRGSFYGTNNGHPDLINIDIIRPNYQVLH